MKNAIYTKIRSATLLFSAYILPFWVSIKESFNIVVVVVNAVIIFANS